MEQILLSGMKIAQKNQWLHDHGVIIEAGLIKAICPLKDLQRNGSYTEYSFPADYYLLPGFIDCHIHGAAGCDVMDDSVESLQTIAEALIKEGVTGFLATTLSAPAHQIVSILTKIPEVRASNKGAALLGVHLEGPFIAKEKIGAHQKTFVQELDLSLIKEWQKMSGDQIKIITLAPELLASNTMIADLREMNMIVSLGHTNASFEQTNAAIQAGSTHATHLFNAMRGIHQREPGVITALLLSNEVFTELIVDGVHLHPAIVEMTWKLKSKDKIVLVTDAIRAKCLGEGQYRLGDQVVEVQGNKAILSDGTLAGSVLCMNEAIKKMMMFTGCSLLEAVQMASLNPAKILNIDHCKGSIAIGKEADLVVMNPNLDVMMTMRQGAILYFK